MLVKERFEELYAFHMEASRRNDLATIDRICVEYDQLLNQAPDALDLIFANGTAHMQVGRNGLAIALFEKCMRLSPNAQILNNLGSAYKAEHLNAQAQWCLEEALKLEEHADYYNNMATLFVNEGCPQKGLYWTRKGLRLDPNHPRLHWNNSLLLLELGKWKRGFEEYEWGQKSMDRPIRSYSEDADKVPLWDGTKGQRVVLYGEQGIGDEIMYASAIPELMKDCEIVFECHPRMVSLFERSFGVKCYGTRKDNAMTWPKDEQLDAKIAIGSLFPRYRSDGKFPRQTYLKPDPELVAHYRKRLEETGEGPYVGIAWAAGSKSTRADLRSLKLAQFDPLFKVGGTFVSLQYTEGAGGKCERYFNDSGRRIHHWPEVVESGEKAERNIGFNYDHTVALVAALDLVVVPNTAVVHVCGAIGQMCYTITPEAPAWRYQLKGDRMPMYGDWIRQFRGSGALVRIAKEYAKLRNRGTWTQSAIAAAR